MKKYFIFTITIYIACLFVFNKAKAVTVYNLSINSTVQSIQANSTSSPFNLNLVPAAGEGGLDFVLTTSDSSTGWYFTNANSTSCSSILADNTIHINSSTSNKHFCYFGANSGIFTIAATEVSDTSLTASQIITVNAPASVPPVSPSPIPALKSGGGSRSGGRHHVIGGNGEVLGAFTSIYGNSSSGSDLQVRFLAIMVQYLNLLKNYQNSLN